MKQQFFIACMLFFSVIAYAQNVGVGTSTPPSKFTTVGTYSNPTIPGATSTGILRIGIGENEGVDFGKSGYPSYAAWIQSGFNGVSTDILSLQPLGGSVGVGVLAPHASAELDVTSTTKGFLPPRMTKSQRDAIASPADGLMISCTDCSVKGLHQYINGAWQAMTSGNTGNYGTVVSPATGKIWLDRNLGASQVATSSTDAAGYGDLYQWGRNADGHQIRTSGTTSSQASNYFTNNGLFITGNFNWLSVVETHMWSGTAAENNPCPSGYRIPTAAEWEQERLTWSSNNAAGAFASSLKLPMGGFRSYDVGVFYEVGTNGIYWSSTVHGFQSRYLVFDFSTANMGLPPLVRADGASVRCIKD
ncbi:MAG TPA: FISUMP domain-containing protein [Saprospiraceae bacterium]|nr:FISUMP domain-containing protein [Saprospiraceae bacterium]